MEDVKKITSEKFDAMLERIINNGYSLSTWYPAMKEALELAEQPVDNYEFIIWILESNPNRELTEEQACVETFLQDLLLRCTQFC